MSARWKSVATPPINFEQTYKETAAILIFLRTNYTTSAFLKVNKHIASQFIQLADIHLSLPFLCSQVLRASAPTEARVSTQPSCYHDALPLLSIYIYIFL